MEPQVRYCTTSDGVSIAFCVAGEGPPLLWVAAPPYCHAQLDWAATWSHLYQPLARAFRLAWYDSRGTGLSERDAIDFSMDAMLRDLEAVVAAAGFDRFPIWTVITGVPTAVTYAATRPARVSHLVTADGWTKLAEIQHLPYWQAEKALRDKDWVLYTEAAARILWDIPDEEFAKAQAKYVRACVEPEAYRAIWAAMEGYDSSALLPLVKAPTLVVHNRDCRFAPIQSGQRLAAGIPGARFVIVDDPMYQSLPTLVEEFVGTGAAEEGQRPVLQAPAAAAPGAFRTVLFTDVAGSTSMMQRLGDDKGRAVLREHERITREALKAHGGTEVKTMGDGFMACFSSATGALECAVALQRAFAEWNADVGAALAPPQGAVLPGKDAPTEALRVRIGLNAGEPIAEEEDLFGTAVILAARIAAKAEGGEILASNVVRELVAGKGFLFADRGDVALRGFEDPVRLYEVRWEA